MPLRSDVPVAYRQHSLFGGSTSRSDYFCLGCKQHVLTQIRRYKHAPDCWVAGMDKDKFNYPAPCIAERATLRSKAWWEF